MTLARMARAHAVAAVIKEAADQEALGFGPFGLMVVDLVIQLGLDGIEEVLIDNARLLTLEHFALEGDLTDIEAIAKQMCERPSRIWEIESVCASAVEVDPTTLDDEGA